MRRDPHWIDGKPAEPANGRWLDVFDPATREITDAYPVVEAWESPVEWQDPHPAILVDGDIAYVTEPAANAIHAVDLTTGEIVSSATLDVTPNEIAVATG